MLIDLAHDALGTSGRGDVWLLADAVRNGTLAFVHSTEVDGQTFMCSEAFAADADGMHKASTFIKARAPRWAAGHAEGTRQFQLIALGAEIRREGSLLTVPFIARPTGHEDGRVQSCSIHEPASAPAIGSFCVIPVIVSQNGTLREARPTGEAF